MRAVIRFSAVAMLGGCCTLLNAAGTDVPAATKVTNPVGFNEETRTRQQLIQVALGREPADLIIRGVSLLGVASAGTARDIRERVWEKLAGDWKPALLERICTRETDLAGLPAVFDTMLAGGSFGRTLVRL